MNHLHVTHHFFPVGQGLFYSGRLRDCWPFQPKQVDKHLGLSVSFSIQW